jgi:hypothetical protein
MRSRDLAVVMVARGLGRAVGRGGDGGGSVLDQLRKREKFV